LGDGQRDHRGHPRQQLAQGRFAAGGKRLAAKLGVSRIVVREANRYLAALGS